MSRILALQEAESEPGEASTLNPADYQVNHSESVGLSKDQLWALRPPAIIDGIIRQGELGLIGAEAKSRKSWMG